MPVSTVRFHSLNIDPLPSPAILSIANVTNPAFYGTVVGGDTALDSKDGASSYVSVGTVGTGTHVVTCRPVITPPIPAGAFIRPFFPTYWISDFAATLMQVAFHVAPTMPPRGGALTGVAPDWVMIRPSDGRVVAASIAESRFDDNPPWNSSFWDETNCGTTGGPPAWSTNSAIVEPGFIAYGAPTDYYAIVFPGDQLLLSQFIGQITWEPNGPFWHHVGGHSGNPTGGPNLQIYTPGVGWVQKVDGPA